MHRLVNAHPRLCKEQLRLTDTMLKDLVNTRVTRQLLKDSRHISVLEQVGMTLYILAKGASYRHVADTFKRSPTSVGKYFHRVLEALMELSFDVIMPHKSVDDVPAKIANSSMYFPYFKDCIGALDGTHIEAVLGEDQDVQFQGIPIEAHDEVQGTADADLFGIQRKAQMNGVRDIIATDIMEDQSQAAFVEGRNIANNISLVQELLCKYNQKNVSKRCMLKINISKAYDMVDWRFLKRILEIFGFPIKFVGWIMSCVTSAHFSVLINGSLEGYFASSRGLRQGDPISPYLFTLVMEVFSRILGHTRQSNDFSFHPKCAGISLSHLMFADDIIIFSKADMGSLMKIKEALALFHSWSGLEVNGNKSAIYFEGCGEEDKGVLSMEVGINGGQLPFSYLGALLDGRSLRRSAYDGLIEKMTSKTKSWTNRCLSYAGRLVLVKHVLSSICSYWMRVILFPKFVLKRVSAICRSFLWSGMSAGKRNLVAWKTVTKTKEEGGLGIKNIFIFNRALMLKQVWDLCLNKEALWIRWMHSYFFKDKSIWEMIEMNHHSWVLKNILRLRHDALKCIMIDDSGVCSWANDSNPFSAKGAYVLMAEPKVNVNWNDLVWNGVAHPKHSFCTWLAIQKRLFTRDRMWGLEGDQRNCSSCQSELESVDHIFFHCSGLIPLHKYLEMVGIKTQWNNWEEVVQWKHNRRWRSKAEKNAVFFIITLATYETWKARNYKIFRGEASNKVHVELNLEDY
ncbi:hypothetical protein QQ045_027699 [Rhodiola kirilowii]